MGEREYKRLFFFKVLFLPGSLKENCKTQKQNVCDKFSQMFSVLDERRKVSFCLSFTKHTVCTFHQYTIHFFNKYTTVNMNAV